MKELAGGMDPAGFAALNTVEPGNYWFEPRNRLIVGLLDKYFPSAQSFMEIGCGTGFVLTAIRNSRPWKRLYGTELHAEGLVFASRRLGDTASLVEVDARNIPSEISSDVVGAFDVLEHIPEDEAVLQGIAKSLKSGGGLIVTVPQHKWLWSEEDVRACHVRRYTDRELATKVERAGFRVVLSCSYTSLLLPLMLVSRMRKKQDQGNEFAIPPKLNAALRAVQQAEVTATLSGLRFPLGGSRVMVAVRN